jgi:hypothetical protein
LFGNEKWLPFRGIHSGPDRFFAGGNPAVGIMLISVHTPAAVCGIF